MRKRSVRPRQSQRGVTIVELLVAMLLVSALLSAILALTRSTLRFTGISSAVSAQTEDTADAESYLTDVLRSAKASTTDISLVRADGTTLVCSYNTASAAGSADRRCFGVMSPLIDVDGTINDFDFLAFSIEPIGTRFELEGLSRGWEGPDTLALFEYRVPSVCPSACNAPPDIGGSVTVPRNPGLILNGLSERDGANGVVDFFNFDGDSQVRLRLVSQASTRDGGLFVVDREPVALFVARRR